MSAPAPSGPHPSERLTLQYFCDPDDPVLIAPFNKDARRPEDTSIWPTSIIVDFFYACAVLRKWGRKKSCDKLQGLTHDVYYGHLQQSDDTKREERDRHNIARKEHLEARNKAEGKGKRREQKPEMEEVMDWISFLWSSHSKSRGTSQECPHSTDAKENVRQWLQTQS